MSVELRAAVFDSPAMVVGTDEYFLIALRTILTTKLLIKKVHEALCFDFAVECLGRETNIGLVLFALDMRDPVSRQRLRSLRLKFPHIRLVVVSDSDKRDDILMVLSVGADGYIQKGLGVQEMEKALRLICRGSVYIPPSFPQKCVTDAALGMAYGDDDPNGDETSPRTITDRQRQILTLLVKGKSNKEMAIALGLSQGTIKSHVTSVFRLLGANNRVEAANAGKRLLRTDGAWCAHA